MRPSSCKYAGLFLGYGPAFRCSVCPTCPTRPALQPAEGVEGGRPTKRGGTVLRRVAQCHRAPPHTLPPVLTDSHTCALRGPDSRSGRADVWFWLHADEDRRQSNVRQTARSKYRRGPSVPKFEPAFGCVRVFVPACSGVVPREGECGGVVIGLGLRVARGCAG